MILSILEIVVLLAVFVGYPLYSWRTYPAERTAVMAGRKSRLAVYGEIMLFEWGSVAVLVALWLVSGKTWSHLGLGPELGLAGDGPGWTALGLSSALLALLCVQTVMVLGSGEAQQQFRDQIGKADALVPTSLRDLAGFTAVSVTAGVCEEILFRGYLFQWLQGLGIGMLGAAAISSVVFGLAHAYQGSLGAIRAGITGAVFMALTILTGSLWAAIVLHALADLSSGFAAYFASRKGGELGAPEVA